jgi:hypothetical protein
MLFAKGGISKSHPSTLHTEKAEKYVHQEDEGFSAF